jgi:hypothetical protein
MVAMHKKLILCGWSSSNFTASAAADFEIHLSGQDV